MKAAARGTPLPNFMLPRVWIIQLPFAVSPLTAEVLV